MIFFKGFLFFLAAYGGEEKEKQNFFGIPRTAPPGPCMVGVPLAGTLRERGALRQHSISDDSRRCDELLSMFKTGTGGCHVTLNRWQFAAVGPEVP